MMNLNFSIQRVRHGLVMCMLARFESLSGMALHVRMHACWPCTTHLVVILCDSIRRCGVGLGQPGCRAAGAGSDLRRQAGSSRHAD